ncbi:MAG: hypothetical protein KIB12_05640, partial [Acinetobacter baumannii]|nr:hypothetical protein [Acinetobacter baumannii]
PIGCAVDFVCRLLHLKIISLKKPLQIGLCNKAPADIKRFIFYRRDLAIHRWIVLVKMLFEYRRIIIN